MLLVPDLPARVERALVAGELACPCPASWRPWGRARRQPLRTRGRVRVLRSRRGRSRACQATHVLLPVIALLRRAYAVTVIGAALLGAAAARSERILESAGLAPWERACALTGGLLLANTTRLDPPRLSSAAGVEVRTPPGAECATTGRPIAQPEEGCVRQMAKCTVRT